MSAARHRERGWTTAPISRSCEVMPAFGPSLCGEPTTRAYSASRGGWAALCERHAANIHPHCTPVADLLAQGETMRGTP